MVCEYEPSRVDITILFTVDSHFITYTVKLAMREVKKVFFPKV